MSSTDTSATRTHYFRIGDFGLSVSFRNTSSGIGLLPSFAPFATDGSDRSDWLFDLCVDDELHPVPKERRERIRVFDTGNGDTIVDSIEGGGTQFVVKDTNGNPCCLLIADATFAHCSCALNGNYMMRSFGLNNALMLIYAFAGARRQTVLMHASLVRQNGYAYPFVAKSGTGKSTHVSMWLRYLPGCDLMNDDNPIIRIVGGQPIVYGGPWSGKTPCYRNVKAPLGAVTRIDRAKTNSIDKCSPIEAFASLLPTVSAMKWEPEIYKCICDTVKRIVETTNVYTLHCLPNREAAEICNKTIRRV